MSTSWALAQCEREQMPTGAQKDWVLECGRRYWPNQSMPIRQLPIPLSSHGDTGAACMIALPDWASDVGVNGEVLVDKTTIIPGEGPEWTRCDWIAAAWLHLTGAAERKQEATFGPIQSYAFRLSSTDLRRYDRAWVNRIFLFLRRWATRVAASSEDQFLGAVAEPEIILTHDVDALRKTLEIRIKQTAFHLWNSTRAMLAGEPGQAARTASRAARFLLKRANLQTLPYVRELEDRAGLRSILHVYGGLPGLRRGSPTRILIDPAYDVTAPEMSRELCALQDGGWTVGLHQSTAAWTDAQAMSVERRRVEEAVHSPVTACRQHWLRFSWANTWRAQEEAGLTSDSTLGFNDRPGFRNSSALAFHPWDFSKNQPLSLIARPMIFMDSHFYDYQHIIEADLGNEMLRWLDEVKAVRGQATVNWHTHTITDAYGWGDGYLLLIKLLSGVDVSQAGGTP